MYDTAARVHEVLNIRVKNLRIFQKAPIVHLFGKGSKHRLVPLMDKTAEHCKKYLELFHPIDTRNEEDFLFYTVIHGQKQQMSPDNIACFLQKYADSARKICPEVPERVRPHQLRHTRAIHLYRGGVPMPLLSEFLGHSSMMSTQIYAYADTEMKREAIRKAELKNPFRYNEEAMWTNADDEMMRKLYGLK